MSTEQAEPAGLESSDTRQGVQSVEIAMRVLAAIERAGMAVSLTQIAADTGMQPNKVHRYLVSLGRAGLVSQARPSGLYDLGAAMRRLGAEAIRRVDEVQVVSEHLPKLRDSTKHAVNTTVWGEHGPVVVRFDYGAYPLPINIRVGATLPVVASSAGRVFLSHLPLRLTEPVIRAEAGAVSQVEIARLKDEVLRLGYALSFDALLPSICSIAAPVFSAGSLPLAVALVVPAAYATDDDIPPLAEALLSATAEMSAELGYVPADYRGLA